MTLKRKRRPIKTQVTLIPNNLAMFRRSVYFQLFIFLGLCAVAQTFAYEGPLTGIKENALYKIPLTPDLKKYMSADLHDMRIYDRLNREVAFVLLREPLLKDKQDFISYEIVSQTHFKNYSEIIVKNISKEKISNIAFNINNSDAHKYCSIEGSEDQKQWYSVSARQELSLAYNTSYTNTYKCIYFPLNDYLYFRLRVEDWNSEPLKINSAGYFKNSVIAGKLNEIQFTKKVKENRVKKISEIQLFFGNNQEVNRIDFKIKSPRFFMRHARIYVNKEQKQKHKTITYRDVLFEFDLSSDKVLFFDVPSLNEKDLFIEIENKDNPPLEIERITCQQLSSYLVCDLDSKNKYVLKCGNVKLNFPEYDLVNFVSTIPQLMPEASVEKLKEIPDSKKSETQAVKEKTFFERKEFLWLCLGLGAVVVLFFSVSLLKDMGKKPNE